MSLRVAITYLVSLDGVPCEPRPGMGWVLRVRSCPRYTPAAESRAAHGRAGECVGGRRPYAILHVGFRGRIGCVWLCGVCDIGRPMDALLVWRIIISDVVPASTTLRVWLSTRLGSAIPVASTPAMTSRSVTPRARFGVPTEPTAATRPIAASRRAQIERT